MSRFTFLLCFFLSVSAWADESAVAVLDIAGTGVEPSLLPTLTEVLTVEIDNLAMYKVIGGRDVQAMLGFEKQKDMVGCTDAACLAEIGGALGVDRIVASHIGRVGKTYVVNIKLINIRMADTEARVYETVKGEVDALIETIKKSVRKLLGPGSKAAVALGLSSEIAPEPEPKPKPEPEPEPVPQRVVATQPAPSVEESSGGGVSRIGWLPITLWATGAVGIGVGALFGAQAKGAEEDANQTREDGTYEVGAQSAIDEAKTKAMLANVLYGVGVAAVAGGFVAWLLGGDDDPTATALVPVMGPQSVGVVISGGF